MVFYTSTEVMFIHAERNNGFATFVKMEKLYDVIRTVQ